MFRWLRCCLEIAGALLVALAAFPEYMIPCEHCGCGTARTEELLKNGSTLIYCRCLSPNCGFIDAFVMTPEQMATYNGIRFNIPHTF